MGQKLGEAIVMAAGMAWQVGRSLVLGFTLSGVVQAVVSKERLYADLIVLPLIDVYRKYYGMRMTLYIVGVFFVTMVMAAIAMDGVFSALHLVPRANPNLRHTLSTFSFNYTFWLNVIFGGLALVLWRIDAAHPMEHGCHAHAE